MKQSDIPFENYLQFKGDSMILQNQNLPEVKKLQNWLSKHKEEVLAAKTKEELKLSFESGSLKDITIDKLKIKPQQIKCSVKIEVESVRVFNCFMTCNKQVIMVGEAIECENCEKEVSGYRRKVFANILLKDPTDSCEAVMYTETVLSVCKDLNKKNIKSKSDDEIKKIVEENIANKTFEVNIVAVWTNGVAKVKVADVKEEIKRKQSDGEETTDKKRKRPT